MKSGDFSGDQALTERIRGLLLPTLEHLRYDLYDLRVRRQGRETLLQVFIDRPEGVSLDDCQRVSESISGLLDQADPLPSAYTLEVSSPGIDRPLRSPSEYQRVLGRKVNVQYRVDGSERIVEGRLVAVQPHAIELQVRDARALTIPLADVIRARGAAEI
jgi:ribosome maturation factor RimP